MRLDYPPRLNGVLPVSGEPDLWFDLSVFLGIEQAHSESFSPSYPTPTNYR